jgi:4-oxalocrotonate tautomerase family enzyme
MSIELVLGELMPIVTVEMWPIPDKWKGGLMERITEAFTQFGIPAEAVTVVIHETPKENWGTGGEQHSIRHKENRPSD